MDTIQYRGAYRYADRAALENALASALEPHAAWRPRFSTHGSSVRIELDVPARETTAQCAAVQVMQTLAYLAVEGIVVARHRDLAVDVFVCGE